MPHQIIDTTYTVSSFELDLEDKIASVKCQWKINEPLLSSKGTKAPCRTLDLLVFPVTIVSRQRGQLPTSKTSDGDVLNGSHIDEQHKERSKCRQYVRSIVDENLNNHSSAITAMKLILPTVHGYPIRTDLIQRRFLTCDLISEVKDFVTLRQQIKPFQFNTGDVLQTVLDEAIGALSLKILPGMNTPLVESALASLELEVAARLSFPWIIDDPLPKKRLALVYGRPDPTKSTASEGIYRAAPALGIDLVILDHEGHWTQDPAMSHMRDEFIACDLTLNEGTADRIVEALSKSKGPIDGITTFTDTHILVTAQAAKRIGVHANPPESLELCRDKQKTREATSKTVKILSVTGVADLEDQLSKLMVPLAYPLIVKPSTGQSSEGVSKVTSEVELLSAIQRHEEHFKDVRALIEPYISGPEVDANFFLLDGRLIWSEVNDDFPSSAEIPPDSDTPNGAGTPPVAAHFMETSTIMPSILPDIEVALLKKDLADMLVRMGFRSGIFHLEARVKDSRKNFAMTEKGMELVDNHPDTMNTPSPSVFLIEINPRLPGHQESFAVEYTYGIDYFAVHQLMALSAPTGAGQEKDKKIVKTIIKALSQPLPAHVQYPTHIVFISAETGGVFRGAQPLPNSLMAYVTRHAVFLQEGEVLPDPKIEGRWPFVGFFLVTAKLTGAEGRDQARTMGELVRENFRYEIS